VQALVAEEEVDDRDGGRRPEHEHPLDHICSRRVNLHPQARSQLLELSVELTPAAAPLRVQLRQPLLKLGVEPSEVELVQFPQIGAVGGVHGVELVHEVVGDLVPKRFVELA